MKNWIEIEKSKEGILQIMEDVKDFEKDVKVSLERIRRCGLTEFRIQQLICIVREHLNMTRRELLRLSEIALTYNKLWATDDNNCFHDADRHFRRIRSTLKGPEIIFKKFTPISRQKAPNEDFRPSVFVKSTLAYAECGRDYYGLKSYPDSVSTLYAEMGAYFTNVIAVLVLCHQELTKEAMISNDAELCLELLNEQCKTIVGDMKGVIGMLSKEKAEQNELLKKSKKAGSLKAFAQQGFHKYNIESIKHYAMARAVVDGAEFGLDNIVLRYFVNNPEKGEQAKAIVESFDIYADKGRGNQMDTTAIAEFVCWTGLSHPDAYNFFTDTYEGQYEVPLYKSVWACRDRYKKAEKGKEDGYIERKLAEDFEKRVKSRSSK